MQKSLSALTTGKPVQYITGVAHFSGMQFQVNEHVLIPRQETEELVELIKRDFSAQPPESILEIGTGSGCISVCLNHAFAKAESTATDISPKALEVATRNANRLLAQNRIKFVEQDILKVDSIQAFDIVVSNPPYVRDLEKIEIHRNVLEHEPKNALFVKDDDPLVFYKKILQLTQPHPATIVYFEINQYLRTEMEQLASQLGYHFEIYRDLNHNWRMMKCWR